jgi:aquaporin Z
MNKYITEFIGTFFLVLTVGLTGNPVAIGAVLMVMIYMGGNISGGHYNPSVTLGVLIRGKINMKDAAMYWIVQFIGAFVAALVCLWFTGKTFAAAPAPGTEFIKALAAEFIFTFALVSVVLNTATTKKAAGNSYFGLAIGSTVMAGAFAVGPISGAAFNPAVALSPIVLDTIKGGNSMQFLPMYLIGTILGGAVAGFMFRVMNPDEYTVEKV